MSNEFSRLGKTAELARKRIHGITKLRDLILEFILPSDKNGNVCLKDLVLPESCMHDVHPFDALPFSRSASFLIEHLVNHIEHDQDERENNHMTFVTESHTKQAERSMTFMYASHSLQAAKCFKVDDEILNPKVSGLSSIQ